MDGVVIATIAWNVGVCRYRNCFLAEVFDVSRIAAEGAARWLVARVTPPPSPLLVLSLSNTPSSLHRNFSFSSLSVSPTQGPDGGYWSESGEQIAWKNLPRGYLPTHLSLSICTYLTYLHQLTYTEPATFRRCLRVGKCISARRAMDRNAPDASLPEMHGTENVLHGCP